MISLLRATASSGLQAFPPWDRFGPDGHHPSAEVLAGAARLVEASVAAVAFATAAPQSTRFMGG